MRRLLTILTFYASLTGVITGPAQAAIPNATVTTLAVSTQTKKVATTDSTGTFNILLLPNVRNDYTRNWDAYLTKRVKIRESVSAVIQVDAFNVCNAAPRRLQLGAKIQFS